MAHGLQDYHNSVNITAQEAAQLISRPKYGAGNMLEFDDDIAAQTLQTLFSISGTGMIYGGFVFNAGNGSSIYSDIILEVDGVQICSNDFTTMNVRGLNFEYHDYIYLGLYDQAQDYYCGQFSYGITFQSSVVVKFYNHPDIATHVESNFIYALI